MNFSLNIWLLAAVVLLLLYGVWVCSDPETWRRYGDWKRKWAGTTVRYKLTINGKVYLEGYCKAGDCESVGMHQLHPEKVLGETVFIPARYIKTNSAMAVDPIRVKRNATIYLDVYEV